MTAPSSFQESETLRRSKSSNPSNGSGRVQVRSMARRRTAKTRDIPSPNSILDRKALLQALEDANIPVKKVHIEAFYQQMHRQHYPSLPDFVKTYYRNESGEVVWDPTPIRNCVTRKKNVNKVQLSRAFLDFLKDSPGNGFVTLTSSVDLEKRSQDGTTSKLAVRLHDGHVVESVIMRYGGTAGGRGGGCRASLCVSSQVGCAMGCTFCATGTMGIRGDLTSAEILEQVVHANRQLAREALESGVDEGDKNWGLAMVRNVVFMGMGEPLNNYGHVVEACRCLTHPKRWNLSYNKVTVSTVGVTPRIYDLTRDIPEISLALSLHAPNQELRSAIVPAAKAYKIEGLIDALDSHMMVYAKKRKRRTKGVDDGASGSHDAFTEEERIQESTRRRAMIEYVMLEGPTSTLECAHQLGKLCENRHILVNLIPYNQTNVKDKLQCPSDEHMRAFQTIVASYGTFCTIRRTMGADIDSACGQLVKTIDERDEEGASRGAVIMDIEDTGTIATAATAQSSRRASRSVARGRKTAPDEATPKRRATTDTLAAAAPDIRKDAIVGKLDAYETDDLERYVKPLIIATALAGASFVASSILFILQRGRSK